MFILSQSVGPELCSKLYSFGGSLEDEEKHLGGFHSFIINIMSQRKYGTLMI